MNSEGEYSEIGELLDRFFARPKISGYDGLEKGKAVVMMGAAAG